jgi:hypothetical protein
VAIIAGTGMSKTEDSYEAGYEAGKIAAGKLGEHAPDLVFVFASVVFDQQDLIRGVRDATNQAPLVGCSAAGEITNDGAHKKSVVAMAISTGGAIQFTTGLGRDIKKSARNAGSDVARIIREHATNPLRLFIMLPDVLTGNGSEVVAGILDVLGEHFPVVGGAAGDDFKFEQTYQYRDDEVVSGTVAGVGMSGDFAIGIGVRHGWMPIGMPMKVTKADGAVIHELDGKPAVSIYEDYFGDRAEELRKEPLARMAITYPIGLKLPDYKEEYLIRDPISVDENGAITCAAAVPEGADVRLMIGSKEGAIEAAQYAATRLMKEFEIDRKRPQFVLMFNCIAREKLYGSSASDEIRAVTKVIGEDVPLIGFYTYGEQAPLDGEIRDAAKCNTKFYNETIVLCGIGE